jgi:hypothetical protein
MDKFKKNTFITVESDTQPGVLRKYLVYDVRPDNYVKLIYQDDVVRIPGRQQLLDYMEENSITPPMLVDIIGKSRATVYRYMSGTRAIPRSVFDRLGIMPPQTHLQHERGMESVVIEIARLRDRLTELLNTFNK